MPAGTLEKKAEGTRVTKSGLVVSVRQPTLFEGGIMRDYQLDGYEWLRVSPPPPPSYNIRCVPSSTFMLL